MSRMWYDDDAKKGLRGLDHHYLLLSALVLVSSHFPFLICCTMHDRSSLSQSCRPRKRLFWLILVLFGFCIPTPFLLFASSPQVRLNDKKLFGEVSHHLDKKPSLSMADLPPPIGGSITGNNAPDVGVLHLPHVWPRTRNLASSCIDIHAIDRDLYKTLDNKTLHIVYFAWLPENGNGEKIIPGQIAEVISSGLFDRPNTRLHFIISSSNKTRLNWFNELDFVTRYNATLYMTEQNKFEYPGIRYFWELGCKHPDDIFLYFHSKGARYNKGRIGMEMVLTREIVVSWRLMLSLLVSNPNSLTFGLGGPGYQWMNFFWTRGSLFPLSPKVKYVDNRYWYEEWSGVDVTKGDTSKPPKSYSQCHLATGMEYAMKDLPYVEPRYPKRAPQYGILRCTSAEVSSSQLDTWSIPAAIDVINEPYEIIYE
jgi:hypothetical protein